MLLSEAKVQLPTLHLSVLSRCPYYYFPFYYFVVLIFSIHILMNESRKVKQLKFMRCRIFTMQGNQNVCWKINGVSLTSAIP